MTRRDSEFQLPPNTGRIGRAVDAELAFHIEERTRELVALGVDSEAARARATQEFGDVEAARLDLRRIDELAARRSLRAELLNDLWTDVRRTIRALSRRPGYALAATLTLALGIGANSAMFALVDRLLLSPPPHIRNGDAVMRFTINEAGTQSGRMTWLGAPYSYYLGLTQQQLNFDVAGAARLGLSMRVGNETRSATVFALTPGYFSLLGTRPALGRFFADGNATDNRSAVISHAVWSRDFARAGDVLGRDIVLGNELFQIVGVAPRGFTGEGIEPVDAWVQLSLTTPGLPQGWPNLPYPWRIPLIARAHAGVAPAAAVAEATRQYRGLTAGTPIADSTAYVQSSSLIPGRHSEGTVSPESRVVLWLQGVSLLVLLIAVANVANLLLIRSIDRRRETAVSMALGVSRVRLVRHVVLESLVLGGVAAIVAALLVRWTGPVLWHVLLPEGTEAVTTPWKHGALVALLALGSTLAMTVVPAILQLKTSTLDALKSGGRGASRRGSRMNDALVIVQVACAIILLVGSGLFVQSLVRLVNFDRGFELDRVVAVRIAQVQSNAESSAINRFIEAAEARVAAVPGVQSAALSLTAPYMPSLGATLFLPGHDKLPGVGENQLGYPSFFAVSPGFFATLGLTIQRGRNFTTADAATAPQVLIVDATMARTFWPNEEAVGQCVKVGADTAPCRTVVGVVQDTERSPLGNVRALRFYMPLAQVPTPQPSRFLFARTAGEPETMVTAVRAAVASVSPDAFIEVWPLTQVLESYIKPWRLGRAVFVVFGVLATIIATIGLYGVIAFGVLQRRRELGIRFALGASRSKVVRLVLLGAGTRMAIGAAVGVAGAFVLGRRLGSLLFQTSPTDAFVFAGALTVVILATLVACALPAWRAVRVDPTVSLRVE